MHLAGTAAAFQTGIAGHFAGHRVLGHLAQPEAQLEPVLAFPGGVVGHHVDVLAVTVGQCHLQALAHRPGVTGVGHLIDHAAGRGDHVATRGFQRQAIHGAMFRQLGRLCRRTGQKAGSENNRQGQMAHARDLRVHPTKISSLVALHQHRHRNMRREGPQHG
jgi:hypothetical protein